MQLPVWFPHRIFEEYLYLTRDYRSLHKLPYFSNAFFGLKYPGAVMPEPATFLHPGKMEQEVSD